MLIRHRADNLRSDRSALSREVGDLVFTDRFAYLVGAAFQRGMPWKKAWEIPYWIDQHGLLHASTPAAMERSTLRRLLEGLPVRPRYAYEVGTRTIGDLVEMAMRFDTEGDAGAIWAMVRPKEDRQRLESGYRIGQYIAHMHGPVLRIDWGQFRGMEREIDVKLDVHAMRLFKRTDITRKKNAAML